MSDVEQYLIDKIQKTNANNPRANRGAVLLKVHPGYEEVIGRLVARAKSIMLLLMSRDNESPRGETGLTNLSRLIGQHISSMLQREPISWQDEIRLGDLFVEAFFNCNKVVLEYQRHRDSKYVVKPHPNYDEFVEMMNDPGLLTDEFLRYTVMIKPQDINGMEQTVNGNEYTLVKDREHDIDVEAPWIGAANKLQQQGWLINRRVYDVINENEDFYIRSDIESIRRAELEVRRNNFQRLGDDIFYQHVDFDYRGRVYYKESYTHFQGSDINRGVLMFAEGKPLTESGLFWLAIHTASCYNETYHKDEIPEWCEVDYKTYLEDEELEDISVDKMTPNDRANWTIQNMDFVRSFAQNKELPVDAEKPASMLACSFEWEDFYQLGDDYLSHLPIPIDGSNNGWQHLGAISKDPQTGELVGLVPVDIQKDFYVQTAKKMLTLVKEGELKDVLKGMPMKSIRKGISKRSSMTRAYSAGATKMADSMWKDCKKEGYDKTYGITEGHCKALGRLMVRAIKETCPGPLETMKYLQELAAYQIGTYVPFRNGVEDVSGYRELKKRKNEIWKLYNEATEEDLKELSDVVKKLQEYTFELDGGNGEEVIKWETPSGFQVEYEKWMMLKMNVRGTISGIKKVSGKSGNTIKHIVHLPSDNADTKGFMSGISPNYIHSMDAAHLALVVANWDGSFGAVHDSFSTHASDVDNLLALTKQIFIDMYDEDNYFDVIQKQIAGGEVDIDQPLQGDLDIGEINDSEYFFL